MKTNDLHKFLENFNLSNIEMPAHQRRLRQALLLHGQNQQTIHTSLWVDCKNLIGRKIKSRRITLIGSGATLAIVAVLGLSLLSSQNTPYARAEGLVNRSIETMQSVPPETRAQFTKEFGRDPLDLLEEAKQAKDLATLTRVEFEAELKKRGIGFSFSKGDQPKTFTQVMASKYLRYTNPSGKVILLGLNDDDSLVFAVTFTSVNEVDITVGDLKIWLWAQSLNGWANCRSASSIPFAALITISSFSLRRENSVTDSSQQDSN